MRIGWLFPCIACLTACGSDDDAAGDTGGWVPAPGAPALMAVIDVWAFSTTDVWFLDGGPAVQRFDGESWSAMDTPSTGGLSCIFALSPSDVFLCAGTQVLHYDGATFTATEVTSTTGLDGLTDLWATSRSDVWVVGDDAIIGHYDGTAWRRTLAGSPFKSSIWGSGPTDIYALDTFDLVRFDGTTWNEVTLDAGGGGGSQVWGTSSSDVWVMTDSSDLLHFDGASWQTIETDFVGDLAAVWGPAPNDLWAAGSAGAIAHYDGRAWRQVTHQPIGAPYLRSFLAVHGTSATDVWAVGRELGQGGSTALIYHRRQ